MSKESFEQKQLDQINKTESGLTEGFIASVILRALYGSVAAPKLLAGSSLQAGPTRVK